MLCCVRLNRARSQSHKHTHAAGAVASLRRAGASFSLLNWVSHCFLSLRCVLLLGVGGCHGSGAAGRAEGADGAGSSRRGHTNALHTSKQGQADRRVLQSHLPCCVRVLVRQITRRAHAELAARRADRARMQASLATLEQEQEAEVDRHRQARLAYESRITHKTKKQQQDTLKHKRMLEGMAKANALQRSVTCRRTSRHTQRPVASHPYLALLACCVAISAT